MESSHSNDVSFTNQFTPAHQWASAAISNAAYKYAPPASSTIAFAPNALNEYATIGTTPISYDTRGNLTSDTSWTFGFDAENRMTSAVKTGTTASYVYDPMGRRQSKTVNGTATGFLDDGDNEIAEYGGTGTLLRRYLPGPGVDRPVAMLACNDAACGATATKTMFHTDKMGSVVAMSATNGTLTEGPYTYDPYGRCFSGGAPCGAGVPFRYTGQRLDPETGLYYYRARYYDPYTGGFLSTDPTGYKDDINWYTYVGNDPTDKVDPSGKSLTVTDPEQQKRLAAMINEKASATYGFDGDGHLVKTSTESSGGKSQYYTTRLDTAIKSSKDILVSIAQNRTFQVSLTETKDFNIDAPPHSGGMTVSFGNARPPFEDTTISGHSHETKNTMGRSMTATAADILMHELVGHAIPHIEGGGTGNAVEDENIVRRENGDPLREANPRHAE